MNFFVVLAAALIGASCVISQEKGNSIIPFPRIGRAGNSMSPGLIPFPRVGRSGEGGIHEMKRQLIPFPRVGKRFPTMPMPMAMPMYMDPFLAAAEYESQYAPWYDPAALADTAAASASSSSDKDDNNIDIDKKNGPNPNPNGGMWFGPRLGRKKRSISDSSAESSLEHSTLDTRTLVKILHNFNWAIVPVKERRTFTPRLGRSSGEISVHTRAQPLTPRLGRSREVVSTELDIDEEAPHYSRSGDDQHIVHIKSTQQPPIDASGPPFSPRLGRDHYSPRLGRSGDDHE